MAAPAHPESVFTYGAPQLKFGTGAADEIGADLARTGARRALVENAEDASDLCAMQMTQRKTKR